MTGVRALSTNTYNEAIAGLEEAGFEVSLFGVTGRWALQWDKKGAHWQSATNFAAPAAFELLGNAALQWLEARRTGSGEEEVWAQQMKRKQ